MNKVPNRNNIDGLETVLSSLFSLHRFGIKPGLERTLFLLEQTGNPHHKIKSVHIAGTNGKGSVSSMIASVLTEAGYKTGLYTSPHILRFNERIRIGGKMINNDDLSRLANKYLSIAAGTDSTFFEITTSIAFDYFAENNVDIAVIETGMGGRYDSTNVVTPLLSIITSISRDHSEYLGDSIAEIAGEKAGIIKCGVPVIFGDMDKTATDVIKSKAIEENSEYIFAPGNYSISAITGTSGLTRDIVLRTPLHDYALKFPLPGDHQLDNLKIAAAAIDRLRMNFEIPVSAVINGIGNIFINTGLRARIETLRQEPLLILDSSHNPDSVRVLADTIKQAYHAVRFIVVFAAMKDKDIASMLSLLSEIADKFLFVTLENDRAATTDDFSNYAENAGLNYLCTDAETAMELAFNSSEPVLITGSFYLAEQVLKYTENINYPLLNNR